MNLFSQCLTPFLCGAGFFALFLVWRKSASRWTTWFPLLKKSLEWALIGVAIVLAACTAGQFLSANGNFGLYCLAFALGLGMPHLFFGTKFKRADKETTTRGSRLTESSAVTKLITAAKLPSQLSLGGVPIPVSAEAYHFLIAGSTGTGKSVAIGTLIESLRARGDTVILVDSGGDFLSKHYDANTDFVFNPYDDRCVGWSPTAEMQGAWDATAMARSIVPDGTGEAKEWNGYAQTFVSAVLRKLWETNRLTLKDFLYYIQAAPVDDLTTLLEGTAAVSQLAAEKTFGSIRTIAGNYVASYDYLPTDQPTFSLSDMIRAEHSGVLFVTYRDDQLDSLRNLIACLLDVAARTILSLTPNPERRVWLIIDEFASIGKVQSIEAVATKARKAGGCLVLGIQSVSQLKDRYGEHGAQTILSCLSTWLVLRCADGDTAEYMSKYIGEAEVKRTQQGSSTSDTGESQNWNEQSTTQRVVLPSQIQAFSNLSGLLKLSGDYPICNIKLTLPKIKESKFTAFDARDFRKRPLLALTPPTAMARAGVLLEKVTTVIDAGPSVKTRTLPLSSHSLPPISAATSGFSSARNVNRVAAPELPNATVHVEEHNSDVNNVTDSTLPADNEQFEHIQHQDEIVKDELLSKETDVPKLHSQKVVTGPKKQVKRGAGGQGTIDPSAPVVETLSSRRRRSQLQQNANQLQKEQSQATDGGAKREKSSGREMRELLR